MASRSFNLTRAPVHSFIHGSRTFASSSIQMASSSKNLYPFPISSNPTAYDIFHLPRDADQAAIKARCQCSPFAWASILTSMSYRRLRVGKIISPRRSAILFPKREVSQDPNRIRPTPKRRGDRENEGSTGGTLSDSIIVQPRQEMDGQI